MPGISATRISVCFPNAGIIDDEMKISQTINLSAGDNDITTTITTEPYSVMLLSSSGDFLTDQVNVTNIALSGGVIHVDIYSTDALNNVKLKMIY